MSWWPSLVIWKSVPFPPNPKITGKVMYQVWVPGVVWWMVLGSSGSPILGLESWWHFIFFFQINFFFQNSSISQILLCGERALALEGGFVTKSLCSPGPWIIRLSSVSWPYLELGRDRPWISGWGCSQARSRPWCVAMSVTSSSLGCLADGAIRKRTWG